MAETLREIGNRSMRGKQIQATITLGGEPITVVVKWGQIVGAATAIERWNVREVAGR